MKSPLSTSSIVRVIEGIKVFGPPSKTFQKTFWEDLKVKYHQELDLLHWVETGKHLPPCEGKVGFRQMPKDHGLVLPDLPKATKVSNKPKGGHFRTTIKVDKEELLKALGIL